MAIRLFSNNALNFPLLIFSYKNDRWVFYPNKAYKNQASREMKTGETDQQFVELSNESQQRFDLMLSKHGKPSSGEQVEIKTSSGFSWFELVMKTKFRKRGIYRIGFALQSSSRPAHLEPNGDVLLKALQASPEGITIYQKLTNPDRFRVVFDNKKPRLRGQSTQDRERLFEFLEGSLASNKPYRKKLEWNMNTDSYEASEWTGVGFSERYVLHQERSVTISSLELDSMKHEISSDWLTNISNRKGLNEFLDLNLNRFEGDFLFGIFDLNAFKSINDSYGHLAGDKILREIAVVAKGWLDPNGIVARVGGDEFAFFQPLSKNITADESLQDLQKAFAAGDYPPQCKGLVDVAIGAVWGNGHDYKISQLWAESDRLMYRAKKSRQHYLLKPL